MSSIEILSYPGNSRVTKLLVAAKYANVAVATPAFAFEKDNATESYLLNCHPLGKVPVAKTADGYLFESNAIARYIARLDTTNALYGGGGAFEAAQVDQWLDFAANELEVPIKVLVGPELGYLPKVDSQQAAASKALLSVFEALNTQLEVRTFLVGERLSLADIVVGSVLEEFFRIISEKKYKEFVNLLRYVDTVINQPNFAAVLATQAAAAPKKKDAKEGAGKKEDKPKEAAKKEDKPKEAPKKEEKPKKKDDDDDEGGPAVPGFDDDNDPEKAKMKAMKAALDNLPPATMNLDEFKRCYSNNDTRSVAAPFFFDKYDPAGFTCFFSKYKYNDELSKHVFMTGNLVGGMFQRMDHLHKYVFGSVCIVGAPEKQEIQGFWVTRGKGMPELMKIVDDIEHYTWEEIADIQAVKEKIIDFLACEGKTFEATPVLEYKIFK